jgi:hypothetical protein
LKYFEAVRVGSERAEKARRLLAEFIPSAKAAIFLKEHKGGEFEPVDEANFIGILKSPDGRYAMLAICDSEGNAKALTYWLEAREAEEVHRKIVGKGVPAYKGTIRAPL